MKLNLSLAVLFLGLTLSTLASANSQTCPSPQNHMYVNYALYNADDYFWAFADDARMQPKESTSMVTLVDPENAESFLLLVFHGKTIFSWNNVGGITGGAAHFLPDLKKKIQNGAKLCPRSTTALGIKQLEFLLTNGSLNPALSSR